MSESSSIVQGCLIHYDSRHLQVRRDFLALCAYDKRQYNTRTNERGKRIKDEPNQECMAKILRVMETLTDAKRLQWQMEAIKRREQGLSPLPEPAEYPLELSYTSICKLLYSTYGESTVRNSIAVLLQRNYLKRSQATSNSVPLYVLNIPVIQEALKRQAEGHADTAQEVLNSTAAQQQVVNSTRTSPNSTRGPSNSTRTSPNSTPYKIREKTTERTQREERETPLRHAQQGTPSLDLPSFLASLSEEQRHELLCLLTGDSSAQPPGNETIEETVLAASNQAEPASPTRASHATTTQPPQDEGKEHKPGQGTDELGQLRPTQAVVVPSPPIPPEDAPWCARTCLQLFDAWRGTPLLVASTARCAQQAAAGLVRHYSREQVMRVYQAMSEDPYWAKQGGVDIEQVANHIARELKKLDHASARSPTTSSSPASREPAVNPYLARSLDKEHNARQLAKMRAMLEQHQQRQQVTTTK